MEAIAKTDLVTQIESVSSLPAEQAEKVLEAIIDTVKEELLKGNQVILKDFAAMKIVEKKAHIVKDPETGHQFISPAENVVSFVPIDNFQKDIESAKLSSIILAVPSRDPFAQVIEFHFSRVGWRVHIVNSTDECMAMLKSGAYLVIIDYGLEGSVNLVREIKATRSSSLVPLITLYPSDRDPETSKDFVVLGDEHLVEPFEVYTLLMLAESELARSSEEEVIFEQQVNFQFGSNKENAEKAQEVANKLFKASQLNSDGQTGLSAAFREAVGNAISHGSGNDSKNLVKVLYLLDREKITMVIQDDGPGFGHKEFVGTVTDGSDAAEAARRRREAGGVGGLGIMLMLKCTDRLEYNDIGNMLTLTKYLSSS
jgi:nucleoid DNA-binding protein/anti-sigma regulatory factor (Ser/Thr protein kinase)